MKHPILPVLAASVALLLMPVLADSVAEDFDFTKRSATDPLLKISTSTSLLPEKDDRGLNARRDEKSQPPMYKRILGKYDVIMLEPLSKEKPAEIDFSKITAHHKGVLKLHVRNHPQGDFVLEIHRDGQLVEKKTIGANRWERFSVPFDHTPVVIRNAANGWHYEFAFIDYAFAPTE